MNNERLSLLVALVYVAVAWWMFGFGGAFAVMLLALVPLGFIWFADDLGSYVNPSSDGFSMHSTPGFILRMVGWMFLLLPAVILMIRRF